MTYVLEPPTVRETPAGFGPLFWRYGYPRGDTLLMTNGVVSRSRTYSVQEVADADFAYIGGHIYPLSPTEYTQLMAAGYGPYITQVPQERTMDEETPEELIRKRVILMEMGLLDEKDAPEQN